MDTDTKDQSTPGVKFRWCRSVPCQTKEVYLILTSITGGQVTLEWKDDLGWYESEVVSLPCGLHSGFILIREKVAPSFLRPDSSKEVDERDYKIDPFFISPHKFGVELFLQSSRSAGVWRENPFLRERYLSFHLFDSRLDNRKEEEPLVSPRKSSSCQELGKLEHWPGNESQQEQKTEIVKSSKDSNWISGGSSNNLTTCGKEEPDHFHGLKLKKWKSLGGDKSSNSKDEDSLNSSSYARSKSLHIDSDKKHEFFHTGQKVKLSRSDGDTVNQYIKASKTLLLHADLHQLKLDVLARTKGVESLLKHSDDEAESEETTQAFQRNLFFKEINPPTNEGYGCLITFESRSTSMDDLGSPRALEDVLVSLTSTDTEPKHHHSLTDTKDKEFHTKETEKDTVNLNDKKHLSDNRVLEFCTEFSTQSRQQEEETSIHSSTSERNCSKYPESDVTIHDDENFQYDSLKNDDHKIPLNIKDVLDSEDSLEYSINHRSKISDFRRSDLQDSSRQTEKGENSSQFRKVAKRSENSEDSDCEDKANGVTGSYNFENRDYPTSAQGQVATNPFVLVHPGSLRSETENEVSEQFYFEGQKKVERINSKQISTGISKVTRNQSVINKNSENRTIVIIKDKRQPKMNTTGTQTSCRILSSKHTQSVANRSLPTFAHKYKENINYSPLPNKVSGPWSTKYTSDKVTSKSYPYSENSQIKKLQSDLYNITKADKILKKIHPFDYRPTFVHSYKIKDETDEESHQNPVVSHSLSSSNSFQNGFNISKRNPNADLPKSSKQSRNISFKNYSNSSSLSSSISSNPRPFSISNYRTTHRSSLPSKLYQTPLQDSYFAPKRVKIVPKPYFSIYGKDASETLGDYHTNKNTQEAKYQHLMSSSLYRNISSPIRPAKSLPDLRGAGRERPTYTYKRLLDKPLRASSSPPLNNQRFGARISTNSIADSPLAAWRRRRSLEDRFPWSSSSGESTDSLIEEADNVTHSLNRSVPRVDLYSRGDIYSRTPKREISSYYARRRTISSGDHITDVPFRSSAISPYVSESSLTGVLRARSETDLRMVGKLSGGNQGEPPYLPYRNEHLSIGQIVKVLIPGEGVALARVVYNPVRESSSLLSTYAKNQNITVVLLSEPTSLTGSVITVPLNKILLAWPKV